MTSSPFEVLGVHASASPTEIRDAWRKMAAVSHPDVGGSHEAMVTLNDALILALSLAKSTATEERKSQPSAPKRSAKGFVSREMSCFTIDALPVDAWHILHLCASECGPILEEEEPYLVEFMMHDTSIPELRTTVCQCEIVPEAGSSMVHVSVYSDAGTSPDVEVVRDYLVAVINSSHVDDSA